jgi:hypothetical protein
VHAILLNHVRVPIAKKAEHLQAAQEKMFEPAVTKVRSQVQSMLHLTRQELNTKLANKEKYLKLAAFAEKAIAVTQAEEKKLQATLACIQSSTQQAMAYAVNLAVASAVSVDRMKRPAGASGLLASLDDYHYVHLLRFFGDIKLVSGCS